MYKTISFSSVDQITEGQIRRDGEDPIILAAHGQGRYFIGYRIKTLLAAVETLIIRNSRSDSDGDKCMSWLRVKRPLERHQDKPSLENGKPTHRDKLALKLRCHSSKVG